MWVVQGSVVIESCSECPAVGDTQAQLMLSRHAEPRSPTQAYQRVVKAVRHGVTCLLAANQLSLHTHQHWEATCDADDTTISPLSSRELTKAIWCPEGFQLTAGHTCFPNQGCLSDLVAITQADISRWENCRHPFNSCTRHLRSYCTNAKCHKHCLPGHL